MGDTCLHATTRLLYLLKTLLICILTQRYCQFEGNDHPLSQCQVFQSETLISIQFIHSIRSSAHTWRKSVDDTIALLHSATLRFICLPFPQISMNLFPLLQRGQLGERRRFDGIDIFDTNKSVDLYHRHNAWVRRTVPKEQLLEFDPANGWKPLCDFLGVALPRNEIGEFIDYPWTNDRAQYTQMRKNLVILGLL